MMLSAAQTSMRPVALSISRTRARLVWASSLLLVGLTAAAMVAWATRPAPVPRETTRTIVSVAPTERVSRSESHWSNGLEARDRHGPRSPFRRMARRWCSARSGVAVQQLYARAMDQLSATPISGTSGAQQSLLLARRSMGRLWRRRARLQEGSSRWRTGGHAVQGSVALRGELGRRRHHRVCASPERGLVACVGRRRHPEALTTPQPGEYQSPAAPHAARQPRRDLHDLERGAALGRHADCRAVP